MFTFLINNANIIMIFVWEFIAIFALLRYFEFSFLKKISWNILIFIATTLNILYPILLSWGQYIVWTYTEITRVLLVSPLAPNVPLPWFASYLRPYLEQPHGYFVFYIFNHFFLTTIVLLLVVVFLFILLLIWSAYKPLNFKKGDIFAIVLSFLIVGWPGVIVLIPIVFLLLILLSLINKIRRKENNISLVFMFLFITPFVVLLTIPLLNIFNLYTLVKI